MITHTLSQANVIVCDFDGTISDQREAIREVTLKTLEHFGVTDVDVSSLNKETERNALFSELLAPEQIRPAKNYYKSIWNDVATEHLHLMPDTLDMLKTFRDKGYKLALLSDKEEPRLHHDMAALGVEGMFDVVVGTNSLRDIKPSTTAMQTIQHKLGAVSYDGWIFIGDDTRDMQLAQALSIPAILIAQADVNDDVVAQAKAGTFHEKIAIVNGWDEVIHATEQVSRIDPLKALPQHFTTRTELELPEVISGNYQSAIKTAPDKTLYFKSFAARKGMQRDDLGDVSRYPELPKGFAREMAGQQLDDEQRMHYAKDVVDSLLNDNMIARIARDVSTAYQENPERFRHISIIYPTNVETSGIHNILPAMMASVLKTKLPSFLAAEACNLPVVLDMEHADLKQNKGIINITKNQRGRLFDATKSDELTINTVGKLARQPIFKGEVVKDALYVCCDDGIIMQSTMRAMLDHIGSQGGKIAAISSLTQYPGSEIFTVQDATVELIELAIQKKAEAELSARHARRAQSYPDHAATMKAEYNDELKAMVTTQWQGLNHLLEAVGMHIDREHPSRSTIANMEAILVGAYLMDGNDSAQRAAFDKTLAAVGVQCDDLNGTNIDALASLPAGNVADLGKIFTAALKDRRIITNDDTLFTTNDRGRS
jgi:phosphoglycolate phosphatase-like HAD superfamily hydrolase